MFLAVLYLGLDCLCFLAANKVGGWVVGDGRGVVGLSVVICALGEISGETISPYLEK